MGLESDILSDLRQLLTEHGVSARWQGIDLLVLISRVKREQQMEMGGFVESPELSLRVPKAAFPATLPKFGERIEVEEIGFLHRQDPEAGRLRQGVVDQRGQGHWRESPRRRAMGDPAQAGAGNRHDQKRRQAIRHAGQQPRLHRRGDHRQGHRDCATGGCGALAQGVGHLVEGDFRQGEPVHAEGKLTRPHRARCLT